jgi:hypothetical protein
MVSQDVNALYRQSKAVRLGPIPQNQKPKGKALSQKAKKVLSANPSSGVTTFSPFQRKKGVSTVDTPIPAIASKGLLEQEAVTMLLATSFRQKLLKHVCQRTPLSRQ